MSKVIIQKISNKLLWLMIKVKNLIVIPKNFSWIFLHNKFQEKKRNVKVKFKKLQGFVLWNSVHSRIFDIMRNLNINNKYKKSLVYPFFFTLFSLFPNFALSGNRIIDSFFQLKKKFSEFLPIIFSLENFHGFLISLSDLFRVFFWKFVQYSILHKISFLKIRIMVFKLSNKNRSCFPFRKSDFFLNSIILRKKNWSNDFL